MNIVFLGTPEIAKVCLAKIVETTHHKVLAVVTNPDRPAGRGNIVVESPVKTYALAHNLKVLQYEKISREGVDDLKALKPDALVLVAFGQILSIEVLEITPFPINLHGSLLPELRGPSPIQSAILEGKKITGVSVMKMERGMDTGPVLLQKQIEIADDETSGTLFEKMANVGADALCEALEIIESGKDVWWEQDHTKATFSKMLTKEEAHLNFDDTAQNIVNKIRAYNPNPVCFFMLDGKRFKVFSAKVVENNNSAIVGTILSANAKSGLVIACKQNAVEIVEMQPENSKRMTTKQYLNGKKIEVGVRVQ